MDMNKKVLPTIRLSEDDLPEIKDWKVGGKYKIMIDVEQISMKQGDEYGFGNKDNKVYASFNVTGAEVEEDDSKCCDCNCDKCNNYETEYAKNMSGSQD